MQIISHRGYWKVASEKNTRAAFERSFALGYGTETDVRDLSGALVISHDMPLQPEMTLKEYVAELSMFGRPGLTQAINIKSDGLAKDIAAEMKGCTHPWFVFDMSVPDMIQHMRAGNPTFARMSEYEPFPEKLHGMLKGIWLDAFSSTWYSVDAIGALLNQGLQVCVVSPELHGRNDYLALWQSLRLLSWSDDLILCTDLPEEASAALSLKSI